MSITLITTKGKVICIAEGKKISLTKIKKGMFIFHCNKISEVLQKNSIFYYVTIYGETYYISRRFNNIIKYILIKESDLCGF